MVVDFPAPLGPKNPTTSPDGIVNETSFTAIWSPYLLLNLFTSIDKLVFFVERSNVSKMHKREDVLLR
jgi:hypothetical protein